ncbi:MAG: hypothetical protein R3F60_29325 [bacterium]
MPAHQAELGVVGKAYEIKTEFGVIRRGAERTTLDVRREADPRALARLCQRLEEAP